MPFTTCCIPLTTRRSSWGLFCMPFFNTLRSSWGLFCMSFNTLRNAWRLACPSSTPWGALGDSITCSWPPVACPSPLSQTATVYLCCDLFWVEVGVFLPNGRLSMHVDLLGKKKWCGSCYWMLPPGFNRLNRQQSGTRYRFWCFSIEFAGLL